MGKKVAEIAVICPKDVYWDCFIRDLNGLWQILPSSKYVFWIGDVKFQCVINEWDRQEIYGMKPDLIWSYNCEPRFDLLHILQRHGAEVVYLNN